MIEDERDQFDRQRVHFDLDLGFGSMESDNLFVDSTKLIKFYEFVLKQTQCEISSLEEFDAHCCQTQNLLDGSAVAAKKDFLDCLRFFNFKKVSSDFIWFELFRNSST